MIKESENINKEIVQDILESINSGVITLATLERILDYIRLLQNTIESKDKEIKKLNFTIKKYCQITIKK